MTSPIVPTIGRIVLLERFGYDTIPAIVTRVHSNDCINVVAFGDGEGTFVVSSVEYAEDGVNHPTYWHWMDYQKQVAGV